MIKIWKSFSCKNNHYMTQSRRAWNLRCQQGSKFNYLQYRKKIVVIYYSKSYTISENLNAKPFLIWKIQAIYGQISAHQWLEEIFQLFDKIFLEKQLVRGWNVAQKPKKCCGNSHWALDLCNLKKNHEKCFFS